jgi:hypothetical protein
MSDTLVFARVPIPLYNGKLKDRGEIFRLANARNDEKLIGLRYLLPFDPKAHLEVMCDMCSRKFVSHQFYEQHKRKKGGCESDPGQPTKTEVAEIIGVDVDKLRIEGDDSDTKQRVFDPR